MAAIDLAASKNVNEILLLEGNYYLTIPIVFEELDPPGEWYLDRKSGKCLYFPYPGEEIQNSKIFAPVAEQLVRFEGDPSKQPLLKILRFRTLNFATPILTFPKGIQTIGKEL